MKKNGCPAVEVDLGQVENAVVDRVLNEMGSEKESVSALRVVPTGSDFKGGDFVLGYISIPAVVNFATKLSDADVLLPRVDMALSRSVLTVATLGAHVLTKGKSFLLGALLGQVPTTLDALAEKAVAHLKQRQMAGRIGTTQDEVSRLRRELEELQGVRSGSGNGAPAMSGVRFQH